MATSPEVEDPGDSHKKSSARGGRPDRNSVLSHGAGRSDLFLDQSMLCFALSSDALKSSGTVHTPFSSRLTEHPTFFEAALLDLHWPRIVSTNSISSAKSTQQGAARASARGGASQLALEKAFRRTLCNRHHRRPRQLTRSWSPRCPADLVLDTPRPTRLSLAALRSVSSAAWPAGYRRVFGLAAGRRRRLGRGGQAEKPIAASPHEENSGQAQRQAAIPVRRPASNYGCWNT